MGGGLEFEEAEGCHPFTQVMELSRCPPLTPCRDRRTFPSEQALSKWARHHASAAYILRCVGPNGVIALWKTTSIIPHSE